MTVYRLMDGVSGRPGTGSTGTQPPSSPTAYSGNFEAAQCFAVTSSGLWFEGYWWWVPAGGDTGPQKFCLYSLKDNSPVSGVLVAGATVTSGTLTAGQWNYVPLAAPVQLSVGTLNANGSGLYQAQTAWSAVHGFPDSANQLGSANPYPNGFSNGPLTCFGASNTPGHSPGVSSVFGTGSADPATGIVASVSGTGDLFWLDIQVSDVTPAGYSGSYRLWPNRADFNGASTADAAVNYVVATEVHLSAGCKISRIWYYSPGGTAQLATRASVYAITGAHSGTEAVSVTSPSWKAPDGTAFTAGNGWCYCDVPAGTTLAAGHYKVAVYNSAAVPDQWSAKDATTDYFGQTLTTGEGASGITWGPLYAPNWANASQAYQYNAAGSANTPPYSDGTGTTVKGQPTFAVTGPQFPYLYAPVGAGTNQSQNYWVDLEVILPASAGARPSFTAGITAVAKALKFQAAARAVTSATAAAAKVFRHRSASRTVTVTISAAASHSGTAHSAGTRPSLTAAMSAAATALRRRTSSRTQTATVSASATVTRHRSATRTVTAAAAARAAIPGGGRTASLPVAARLTARTAHSTVRGTHVTMTAVISATAAKSGTGNASPGAIAILAASSGPPGTLTASSGPTAGGG